MCIPDRLSVVQCSHGHVIGVAFFRRDFSGVKRTCWTTGSWRSCLSLEVVSSIPAWSTIIYGSFVGLYAFPCARASKLNQQICISPAPGRSSKLTHTGVEIDTMCIPDRLSVVQCSHGHVIGVAFFRRDFSGVKRTCWTTGSWRSCLSLEVVSSIPAWSTIINRFLCGFICVSLCQSIKIKPTNMYIASARAQFKINTHRCWNWHHVHSRQVVSCPVQPRARYWSCFFLARFQWCEAYVLDNWQLTELPQSGGREFDPRLVHDNLSVPLWVYMRFPVPEHQN